MNATFRHHCRRDFSRAGFTLVELLITISIIAILAGTLLAALGVANDMAKEHKTKSLITKLDSVIKEKFDNFRTRRVPITITPGTAPAVVAKMRLDALREMMRMEMPDTWNDVADNPVLLPSRTSTAQSYYRKYSAGMPSAEAQNAECLYLIVMSNLPQDGDSRDAFNPGDIKDTDGDGYPEFVDGWGKPIRFIRWPVGFPSELQVLASGSGSVASGQLQVSGPSFSHAPGSYIGGAVVFTDATTGQLTNQAARIVDYQYATGTATFTFDTASGATTPFGGASPNGRFAVTSPDPFDPRGIYPLGNTSPANAVSYATYPLIYSAGSDGEFGIKSAYVTMSGTILGISSVNNNPFGLPPMRDNDDLVGATAKTTSESYSSPWHDNIHNHALGTQ